jgi:hypothetical protein
MRKIAVVTGASSGMGRSFAIQISERYKTIDEIWVIARRKDRLMELQKEIKDKIVRVIPIDITKEVELNIYRSMLEEYKPSIRVLVNAAGYGIMGHVDEVPYEASVGMIDVNCKALVAMTHISLPYMTAPSNIINVASVAAFVPQPSFAIYAATKSLVLSFSRALNKELEEKEIYVTAVCPGPVNTEFFEVAEQYSHTKAFKKLFRVNPENVVKKALYDAYYYKPVSVYSLSMNAVRVLTKLLPHDIIINVIK